MVNPTKIKELRSTIGRLNAGIDQMERSLDTVLARLSGESTQALMDHIDTSLDDHKCPALPGFVCEVELRLWCSKVGLLRAIVRNYEKSLERAGVDIAGGEL